MRRRTEPRQASQGTVHGPEPGDARHPCEGCVHHPGPPAQIEVSSCRTARPGGRDCNVKRLPVGVMCAVSSSSPPISSGSAATRLGCCGLDSIRFPVRRSELRLPAAAVLEARVLVEVADRVPADRRRRFGSCQLIPEQFKTDGSIALPLLPEDVDDLAEHANRAIGAVTADALNRTTDLCSELLCVRLAIHHERGQRVLPVEQYEVS